MILMQPKRKDYYQGRNQDFAKGEGAWKWKIFVTLFWCHIWCNMMTSPKWCHNWYSWSFITS